ncbi:MAG: hypothetical protein ACR2M3_13905 [Thermomicrobiales bacterium]
MVKPLESIDITDKPDLVAVAEEVQATGEPHTLQRNNEAVAIITPIMPVRARAPQALAKRRLKPKKMTEADIEAFFSAAGSWADVDTDTLIANIYADRENSNRPPPEF